MFFLNFLFCLFIKRERERERERDKGGETVLLVSCQCEGIGNGSAAEAEDMSEKKVVREGSANADRKADVQQSDCGKSGYRVDGWFVLGVFVSILLGIFFTAAVCYLWLLFLWYLYSLA